MRVIDERGLVYDSNDYLAHHGILGMKWGKKNGPPYPLGASDHSAAEKKAVYKKSIGGGRNENLYGRKVKKANKISDKYDKKIARVQKDIDSFEAAKDGIKDRKGREILTKADVSKWISDLKEAQNDLRTEKTAKLAGIEASAERKYEKVSNKFDKRLEKSRAYDEKVLAAREKNQQKISDKYDKKIAKVQKDIDSFKADKDGIKDRKGREVLTKDDVSQWVSDLKEAQNDLKMKKSAKLGDFKAGTDAIKAGNKKYNQILESYKGAKLSALQDRAYKKNPNYKKAVRDYVFQSLRDANNYGVSGMTKLQYSSKAARSTISKIKALKESGKSASQIAQMTGYSKATIEKYI